MIKLLYILILVFNFNNILPQNDSTVYNEFYKFKLDEILIEGNKITEPEIILREINFSVGDTLTSDIIHFNRERIYSLGIFNHVELIPFERNDSNYLLILVEESWYIYPIPLLELKERSFDKISYGIDLQVKNFRGRNEFFRTRFAFGYDPSFSILYTNPWIDREHNLTLRTEIFYNTIKNRSKEAEKIYGEEFSQKFIGLNISSGKRFDNFNTLSAGISYSHIETPKTNSQITPNNNRVYRVPAISISYKHDTRDLVQFPTNGSLFSIEQSIKWLNLFENNYLINNIDYRYYSTIYDKFSGKIRFATRNTSGEFLPYHERSFLGLGERIRGHFTSFSEGDSYYITSFEVKYPLLEEWNISFDLPIIPKELLSYRVAVYVQSFFDAGFTKFNNQSLSAVNIKKGFGFGLTFLVLPYNIGRIEVGFNEFGKTELILDLGISF